MQCFIIFMSDDSKQDTATTTAHSKHFIEILKHQKLLTSTLIKIWENTDSCAEQYICASTLYLMSVLSQCFSVIIYRGISATGHGKEVVNGINSIYKAIYISINVYCSTYRIKNILFAYYNTLLHKKK